LPSPWGSSLPPFPWPHATAGAFSPPALPPFPTLFSPMHGSYAPWSIPGVMRQPLGCNSATGLPPELMITDRSVAASQLDDAAVLDKLRARQRPPLMPPLPPPLLAPAPAISQGAPPSQPPAIPAPTMLVSTPPPPSPPPLAAPLVSPVAPLFPTRADQAPAVLVSPPPGLSR
jgi:hypothetical protein